MSNTLAFKTANDTDRQELVENKDTRTVVQKMFCDFNKTTGALEALPLHPETRSEYKHLHDCIPILTNYKSDDAEFTSPLKGKTVLVFGGRRKSRAGTGVEFMMDLDHVEEFADLLKQVAVAAKSHTEEEGV